MDASDDKSRAGEPPPYASHSGQPAPQMGAVGSPIMVQPGMGGIPVVVAPAMGPQPANVVCPSCHAAIQTRVEKKPTTKTHLFALVLCLFACWCCACIPYCIDTCNNGDHYCPNCNAYIGTYLH